MNFGLIGWYYFYVWNNSYKCLWPSWIFKENIKLYLFGKRGNIVVSSACAWPVLNRGASRRLGLVVTDVYMATVMPANLSEVSS